MRDIRCGLTSVVRQVADVAESVLFVKYNKSTNALVIFADDVTPRWCTTMCNLDYDSVAVADKFGNIFVSRLPAESKDDVSAPIICLLHAF